MSTSNGENDTKDGKPPANEEEQEGSATKDSDKTESAAEHQNAHQHRGDRQPAPEVALGYRDYSRSSPAFISTGSCFQSFPQKLHEILSNPDYCPAISWLPHGRAWIVHNTRDFEQTVLPRYFRHGRHASFARQVNGWGFRRITSGSDYNGYYHEMFLRGLPHLCQRMKRPPSQEIKIIKREPDLHPIPEFYAISRYHPLPEEPGGSAALPTSVSSQTVVTNSASSGITGNFPMFQGLDSQQFSQLGGNSAAAGLGALWQQMRAAPQSGSTAGSMSTGGASNSHLPNGTGIAELAAVIHGQQQQQQQQQQNLPLFEAAPQNLSVPVTDAIVSLLRHQVMGSTTPAQLPVATASLPQGTKIEQVLAILRQQVASVSSPAPKPVSKSSVAASPPPALPPALVAALLAQQQSPYFHNSAPAPSAMGPPVAAAASGPASPPEPQQGSANGSAASFLSANMQQASNVNPALLVQLSQQLASSTAGSAGAGSGGGGGVGSNAQQLVLLQLMQGLSSSAGASSVSSPPIAPAAPPPQPPHPPPLPPRLNIQDLLRQLGNASRNNSMGGGNNNKMSGNLDRGNPGN